jgi:hypothetical protein
MKSVPVCFHLQESSVVCPECGSAIRVADDLCLGCMLSQGIGVDDANDEALAELLGEMDGLAADARGVASSAKKFELQCLRGKQACRRR